MTDIDDLLKLPVEDDDEAAEHHESEEPRRSRAEPIAATELISLSSSEARLATALLMQAQALEGMRREQSDLLKRIEGGPSRAALVRSLGQVEVALKQVAKMQQKARGQIARTRRRSTRLIAALLFLTLGLVGVVGWMAWTTQKDLPASISMLETRFAENEASRSDDIDRAVSQAVALVAAGSNEALTSITDRLDGEQTRLLEEVSGLKRMNDETRDSLNQSRTDNDGLRRELGTLAASHADLDQQLSEVRQERNRQIGENARLVGKVLEGEQRLQDLTQTVASLGAAQQGVAQPAASAIIDAPDPAPEGLAGRITDALKAGGAADLTVLEVDGISEGVLQGVLLRRTAPDAEASVLRAGRAWVVIDAGRARLRLDPVREQGDVEDSVIEIELPALDALTWRSLGLTVPAGFTPLPNVIAALDELLAGTGWRVASLTSFDGMTLGGLELVQENENGLVLRSLKAATGLVVPTGPELELREGSIRVGDDERPFYRDVFLLPLPGFDYGGWLAATDGSGW